MRRPDDRRDASLVVHADRNRRRVIATTQFVLALIPPMFAIFFKGEERGEMAFVYALGGVPWLVLAIVTQTRAGLSLSQKNRAETFTWVLAFLHVLGLLLLSIKLTGTARGYEGPLLLGAYLLACLLALFLAPGRYLEVIAPEEPSHLA